MAGKKSKDKAIPVAREAKDPWAKVEWWKKTREDVPYLIRSEPRKTPLLDMLMPNSAQQENLSQKADDARAGTGE